MNTKELRFVLDVLQDKKGDNIARLDWYAILGFLEISKITVPFINKAEPLKIDVPQQITRNILKTKNANIHRNNLMQAEAKLVSLKLKAENIKIAFLKGSILSSATFYHDISKTKFYDLGERTSNDIDILMKPESITLADKVLKNLSYVQGYYNHEKGEIVPLSRAEKISRRMNRGETAPYIKATGDVVCPFLEIDINISIDHLPTGNELLLTEMLNSTTMYDNGLQSLSANWFFIHLLMHQYKEMSVYSMVKRGKDNELYKYLDIYRFIQSGIIDTKLFCSTLKKFNIEIPCYSVLNNLKEIFAVNFKTNQAEDFVFDPENNNKKYVWNKPLFERLKECNHLEFLSEEK